MSGAYEVVTTPGFGAPAGSDGVVVTTPSFTWDAWTPPSTSGTFPSSSTYPSSTTYPGAP